MADLNVTVGADLSQYEAGMKQAASTASSTASSIGGALNNASKQTDALGNSAMSASMRMMQMRSGLSAARDGVVGFAIGGQSGDRMLMAMGHHINSLINETGSFKGALSAMGGALMGPGGVILAITAAVEVYKHFSKESEEAKNATKDFVDTLNSVNGAQLEGKKNGQEELIRLRLLYEATQNHSLSIEKRTAAYKELEDKYPAFFTNAEREKTLLGQNTEKYNELTTAILAAAMAKAAEDRISKNTNRQLENSYKNIELDKELLKLTEEVNSAKKAGDEMSKAASSGAGQGVGGVLMEESSLNKQIIEIIKKKNDLLTDSNKLRKENNTLSGIAMKNETTADFKTDPGQLDKVIKKTQAEKDAEKDRKAALKVQQEYDNKELESSLVTEAKEIQIANDKFNKELAIEKKGGADITSLVNYHNGQIEAIHKKYADKRSEIAQKIEDEIAGIGEVGRDRELAANQKWYDEKLKQIKDFGAQYEAEKIKLDNALKGKNEATNLKFDDKEFGPALDERKKQFDSGEQKSIKLFDGKKAQKDLDNWFASEKKKIIAGGKDIQAQLSKLFDDYSKKVTQNKAEEESVNRRVAAAGMLSDAFSSAFNSIISGSQSATQAIVSALEQMIVKFVEAIAEAVILAGIMSALGLGSFSALLMGGGGSTGLMSQATGGIIGHAAGGITLKPHMAMVGEGGESEVIAPLSKLKGMMGATSDGGTMKHEIYGKIKGNDLILSNNRTNASNSRRT